MNERTMRQLEYDQIKQKVAEYAVSYLGKEHVERMGPLLECRAVRTALDDANEALAILNAGGSVPIPSLQGIDAVLNLLGTGYVFSEDDFSNIYTFLHSCTQLRKYMASKAAVAPRISQFAASLHELDRLKAEIERCLRHGSIVDTASKELNKVRKKIAVIQERIKSKIQALLTRHRDILQENLVGMRGDRYVLPVKKEHRKRIAGTVLGESSSGQTVYIEPGDIAHLQHELHALRAEEAREEAKVLSHLTGLAEEAEHELRMNVETIGEYDYLFAKAKYALSIGGRNVEVNDAGVIDFRGAVHPLLGSNMVPLGFSIGRKYRSLIITGPNTGGKTVALKTVGLLTLMVQSGLLVPVQEGSTFAVFAQIAADIGDGQSIEQSLSTFSSHIRNMIEILQDADRSTLVLVDEMATGTDPGEGVGLSIAILEELYRRQATVIATTHFNEIKHFAATTAGFENARMEFDTDTLKPLYRLRIGEAGSSYAFVIARNLGMSPQIIRRSQEIMEGWGKDERAIEPTLTEQGRGPEARRAEQESMPEATQAKQESMAEATQAKQESMPEAKRTEQESVPEATRAKQESMPEATQARQACMAEAKRTEPGQPATDAGEGHSEPAGSLLHPAGGKQGGSDGAGHTGADQGLPVHGMRGEAADTARPMTEKREKPPASPRKFRIGDSVYVSSLNKTGIVYREEDAQGLVGVMIQKQKVTVNQKRLSLHIPKEELYPDDYDFDIIFETKEDRKKKKLMSRKHVEGLTIVRKPEEL